MSFLLQMESMIDNIGYPDYVLDDKRLEEEFKGVNTVISNSVVLS